MTVVSVFLKQKELKKKNYKFWLIRLFLKVAYKQKKFKSNCSIYLYLLIWLLIYSLFEEWPLTHCRKYRLVRGVKGRYRRDILVWNIWNLNFISSRMKGILRTVKLTWSECRGWIGGLWTGDSSSANYFLRSLRTHTLSCRKPAYLVNALLSSLKTLLILPQYCGLP
jgi:hypothetical protein